MEIGAELEVTIEKVAHGGHFIARHEGQVIFVRDCAPGEKVLIEITGKAKGFLRAKLKKVIEPARMRVSPPCKYAGDCGGCDFQHIEISNQRKLKADVIIEQFSRIAKLDIEVTVEEVAPTLHWRSHIRGATNALGQFGIYASRSNEVVPIEDCLIAHESLHVNQLAAKRYEPETRVEVPTGDQTKTVLGQSLLVKAGAFWQRHINAPDTLAKVFLEFAELKTGDHLLDLYGGVGLFTAVAIEKVGLPGRIDLIESGEAAVESARENFKAHRNINIRLGSVEKELRKIKRADVVVLDPPRAGIGAKVVQQVISVAPRRVVYVACDPASLARDVRTFIDGGWNLAKIKAFDLFPMTHHIETVALLTPNRVS